MFSVTSVNYITERNVLSDTVNYITESNVLSDISKLYN